MMFYTVHFNRFFRRPFSRAGDGFTLIELLIVIGLLGALGALLLSNLGSNRTDTLDASIVQKELSDIQRAFQRFYADCVPGQVDLKHITKYGLAVLMDYEGFLEGGDTWSFPEGWDNARGKGWRGPYLENEGIRTVNIAATSGIADNPAQPAVASGTTADIKVVCTPYVNDDGCYEGSYYRVVPEVSGTNVIQLWVVFPSHDGQLPASPGSPASYEYKRQLLLNN